MKILLQANPLEHCKYPEGLIPSVSIFFMSIAIFMTVFMLFFFFITMSGKESLHLHTIYT